MYRGGLPFPALVVSHPGLMLFSLWDLATLSILGHPGQCLRFLFVGVFFLK